MGLATVIIELSKSEIKRKYAGTFIGWGWLVVQPILMLIIYAFVFVGVFKSRWGVDNIEETDYVMLMYVGLMCVNFTCEVANRSTTIVKDYGHLLKKTRFESLILPIINVMTALVSLLIGYLIWICCSIYLKGFSFVGLISGAAYIGLLLLYCTCLAYLLSGLSVYLKDMNQIIGLLSSGLVFLTPVFFPPTAIPERLRWIVDYNPLTAIIEAERTSIYFKEDLQFLEILYPLAIGMTSLLASIILYKILSRGFADEL